MTDEPEEDRQVFAAEEVAQLLRDAGYDDVEVLPQGGGPLGLLPLRAGRVIVVPGLPENLLLVGDRKAGA